MGGCRQPGETCESVLAADRGGNRHDRLPERAGARVGGSTAVVDGPERVGVDGSRAGAGGPTTLRRRSGQPGVGRQGSGGLEEPVEGFSEVVVGGSRGRRSAGQLGEIALDVFDRARQDVEIVPELVERGPRDDQLVLADAELVRSSAGLEVSLPAGLLAEATWPPRAAAHRQGCSTPRASRRAVRRSAAPTHHWFCHCDEL
jgi:hypothetical protein